ncbi:response regulator transcription factor [Motiliproteus sp. SC1-56]|uniref:response regulator transcription factor n=1 Tax=Motiliproteus sp. SC1-56 TaxID=2799565 RepID=UPI001A8D058C|nr:response regulator transcription factor [Motiliproteus sp. SC1-56]
MQHIAILEPERSLAISLMAWLQEAGYRHTCCSDPEELVACLEQEACDLLLFDCRGGASLCEDLLGRVRASQSSRAPLLYIAQRGAEAAVVRAFELGADDYMVRPFGRDELLSRVRVLLDRHAAGLVNDPDIKRFGPFEFNYRQRRLLRDGRVLELTDKDFSLAAYLFSHPDELLSRHRLLSEVWGVNQQVNTRTVDMHISRLRKSLTLAGTGYEIKTVHQQGYCLRHGGRVGAASVPENGLN